MEDGKQFDLTVDSDVADDPLAASCVQYMFMPLIMEGGSFPTVTVSGLPAGMKFNAKNLLLSGKISAPSGSYYATFTGKNLAGYTLTVPVRFAVITVHPFPIPRLWPAREPRLNM